MSQQRWLRCIPPLTLLFVVSSYTKTLPLEDEKVLICDKRPTGTVSPQTKADGRFYIKIVGTINGQYLPENTYTVQLLASENSFTSFLIMADGEYVQEKGNARNHYYRNAGVLRPKSGSDVPTQNHIACKNSVQQANNSPKTKVEVEWIAPEKNQGCVTIHAMVAENQDVWYMDDDGPLKTRVCEDTRKIVDIEPIPLSECQICGEAKYKLTFEGQWSRNTHPRQFPTTATRKFSDLVGASHDKNYYLWDHGREASPGLKKLAESTNTTVLEQEIQEKFDRGVRTLIKATGHEGIYISEPTSAIFRADSNHHMISIAASIAPSPDWFLGVSHFELCFENNTWVTDRELNLYLIDAGTDNGVSYESSNEETLPPGIIQRIRENKNPNSPFFSEDPATPIHFAKMSVQLLRVYNDSCQEGIGHTTYQRPPYVPPYQVEQTSYTTERQVIQITNSPDEPCPLSPWTEYSECEPKCGMDRYKYRERYVMVNGIELRYQKGQNIVLPPRPKECDNVTDTDTFDTQQCEPEPCTPRSTVASKEYENMISSKQFHKLF